MNMFWSPMLLCTMGRGGTHDCMIMQACKCIDLS